MARKKKTEEKTDEVKGKPKVVKAPKKKASTKKDTPKKIKKEEEKIQKAASEPTTESEGMAVDVTKLRCISCGTYVAVGDGSVKFPCPECGDITGRCANCRALGRTFYCNCGYVGP